MPSFVHRYPDNVAGRFYVDDTCLDCDLCRETAPNVFKRNDQGGFSYVAFQPQTEEEVTLCNEAVEGCPCESIGADGDTRDWNLPAQSGQNLDTVKHKKCAHCSEKKSLLKRFIDFFLH